MPYCSKCGNFLTPEQQQCSRCGAPVEPGTQKPASPPQGTPQPNMPPPGAQQPGIPPYGAQQPGMPPPGAQQPGMPPYGAQQPGMPPQGTQQPGMPPQGTQQPGMPPYGAPPPYGYQPNGMPPAKKNNGCVIAVIIAVIVGLIGIGAIVALVLFVMRQTETQSYSVPDYPESYGYDFEIPEIPEFPENNDDFDSPDFPDFDDEFSASDMEEFERLMQEWVNGMSEAELDQFVQQYNDQLYSPAPEYYELGLAYFMDDSRGLRDCYLPYGQETEFSAFRAYSKRDGVSIAISATNRYADAKEALENTEPVFTPEGVTVLTSYDFGITTADMDTVGMHVFGHIAALPDGTETTYLHIVYADIKSEGFYMLGQITLHGPEFDDGTTALLEEVADCYAITLPTDYQALSSYVETRAAGQE